MTVVVSWEELCNLSLIIVKNGELPVISRVAEHVTLRKHIHQHRENKNYNI